MYDNKLIKQRLKKAAKIVFVVLVIILVIFMVSYSIIKSLSKSNADNIDSFEVSTYNSLSDVGSAPLEYKTPFPDLYFIFGYYSLGNNESYMLGSSSRAGFISDPDDLGYYYLVFETFPSDLSFYFVVFDEYPVSSNSLFFPLDPADFFLFGSYVFPLPFYEISYFGFDDSLYCCLYVVNNSSSSVYLTARAAQFYFDPFIYYYPYYMGFISEGGGNRNSYDQGYVDGLHDGYSYGHYEGFQEGHSEGYDQGYNFGYSHGLNKVQSDQLVSSPLSLFLQPVSDFMNLKLFGSLSLSMVFSIVLFVALAVIFIKMFAGG